MHNDGVQSLADACAFLHDVESAVILAGVPASTDVLDVGTATACPDRVVALLGLQACNPFLQVPDVREEYLVGQPAGPPLTSQVVKSALTLFELMHAGPL